MLPMLYGGKAFVTEREIPEIKLAAKEKANDHDDCEASSRPPPTSHPESTLRVSDVKCYVKILEKRHRYLTTSIFNTDVPSSIT